MSALEPSHGRTWPGNKQDGVSWQRGRVIKDKGINREVVQVHRNVVWCVCVCNRVYEKDGEIVRDRMHL